MNYRPFPLVKLQHCRLICLKDHQSGTKLLLFPHQVNEKTFKELVVPLVSQVVDQLKSKHCADIKVYLVGITSKFPYPVMYDTDREYLEYFDQLSAFNFTLMMMLKIGQNEIIGYMISTMIQRERIVLLTSKTWCNNLKQNIIVY